ncbi:hypothetical protein llap_13640 [Limosa lapponica baueri]|uniref:Rna-directed dna polymerase from mobile element jockey-like n=1 Tax=Limosa lapponica baueri TaxID=1758121 RepID=A0A2I0TQH9_LIMLA|nr:hypothetical protein llap_13640 [Limosa lapponica baueri]
MGSAVASSESVLELALIGAIGHGGSFEQLLTEASSVMGTGEVPEDWKTVNVIPVFKKDRKLQTFCDEITSLVNTERAVSVVQFDLSRAFDTFDPVFHNVREEGNGSAPGTVADSSAVHGEDYSRADIHTAAHEGPQTGAGGNFLKERQPTLE